MNMPENEPSAKELDELLSGEEREEIAKETVPDEVRAEILEELEAHRQAEQDFGKPDGP